MSEMMVNMWNDVADAFDQRYNQIGDQWDTQTPCDEWDVKGLVEHTVGVLGGVAAGVGGVGEAVVVVVSVGAAVEVLEAVGILGLVGAGVRVTGDTIAVDVWSATPSQTAHWWRRAAI